MNKITFIAGAALLAASVPGAFAASPTDVVKAGSLKIGGFFPSDSGVRNFGGDVQFLVGADYSVWHGGVEQPIDGKIYLDYAGNSKHGNRDSVVGGGVSVAATQPSTSGGGGATYEGAGLGVYRVEASSGGVTDSKTSLGGKLFAGYDFSGGLFTEASYNFFPKVNGTNTGGFGLQLGMHF